MKKLLLIVLVAVLPGLFSSGASRRPTVRSARPSVQQTLDSLHWLFERYCDLRTGRTGRDDGTLRTIGEKYSTLPPVVADSFLAAQYDRIVRLFEQERNARAYALTDCYYSLARPDDPNLGPLYLNDMVLAIERDDSLMLRDRIGRLRLYADRNGLDYDSDLAEAEENMSRLRRRIRFHEIPFKDFLTDDRFWVLDMSLLTPERIGWIGHIPQLMKAQPSGPCGFYLWDSPKKSDLYASMQNPMYKGFCIYTVAASQCVDEKRRMLFKAWGTERGGASNPVLLAGARQTVQDMHAQVAGELARKKYSYGKRLGGNLIATAVDVGLNALFDRLSVTTQVALRYELSLTLVRPDVLEGFLCIARAESRSDNPFDARIETANIPLRYYRTYPDEGLYFLGFGCEPMYDNCMLRHRYDSLLNETKIKEKSWKAALKTWKKANKGKTPPREDYWSHHNDSVLSILRTRAMSSLENIPLK